MNAGQDFDTGKKTLERVLIAPAAQKGFVD
jgi:hypothetical protein